MRYLDRLQPLALLVMRLVLGAIMVAHGYHKVFGGLHHSTQMVYVAALIEFVGGLLLSAGFFTRCAALAVTIELLITLWKVHLHNGLIGSPDRPGYELPLALAALACALIFFGAGPISLDHVLRGGGSGASRR